MGWIVSCSTLGYSRCMSAKGVCRSNGYTVSCSTLGYSRCMSAKGVCK